MFDVQAAAAVVGRSSLSAFELHEVGRIVKEMEEGTGGEKETSE